MVLGVWFASAATTCVCRVCTGCVPCVRCVCRMCAVLMHWQVAREEGRDIPWAMDPRSTTFQVLCGLMDRCLNGDRMARPSIDQVVAEVKTLQAQARAAARYVAST